MGKTEKCYKYTGYKELGEASAECAKWNSKLPLPKNIQQNSDLVYVLRSLQLHNWAYASRFLTGLTAEQKKVPVVTAALDAQDKKK